MLIVCPTCATSYQVEPHSLGQDGRSVRCARCQNVWFATVPAVVATLPGSDQWDVIDTGPRVPWVDGRPGETAQSTDIPILDSALAESFDLAGLSAELNAERAEQEAEADAVLAEVGAQESASADSPPLVPAQPGASAKAQQTAGGEDIETFAARRTRRDMLRRPSWLKPSLPAAILALVAANAAVVAWRSDVVRLLPQTASLYAAIGLPVNLRGLAFDNIRMSRVEHEGVSVLVVEGSIVNVTGRPVEIPRLRLAVRNEAKNEVYAWTIQPSRSILAPGEALPFRSRLASPPADAREVQVRFFSRRDIVAGLN